MMSMQKRLLSHTWCGTPSRCMSQMVQQVGKAPRKGRGWRVACEWNVVAQGPEDKIAGHMLFLHLHHDCNLGQVRSCRTWPAWESFSR